MTDSTISHPSSTRRSAYPVVPLDGPAHRPWRELDGEQVRRRYVQGALALTYPLPGGLETEPRSSALTLVNGEVDERGLIPDAETWAGRFVQAVVEVVSSERPLPQLARWTDPAVYDDIAHRRARVAAHRRAGQTRPGRQQVATVHIWQSAPDAAEVAARVTVGNRSRAIAARLDFRRNRWLCTAITFG